MFKIDDFVVYVLSVSQAVQGNEQNSTCTSQTQLHSRGDDDGFNDIL